MPHRSPLRVPRPPIRLLVLLLALVALASVAVAGRTPFRVEALPLAASQDAEAGAGIVIRVPAGHHVYRDTVWVAVVDDGGLSVGEAQLPPGVEAPDPASPTGRRELYDGDVVLRLPVRAGEPGRHRVLLDVHLQGCREGLCYPPVTERVELPVDVEPGVDFEASDGARGEVALIDSVGGAAAPAVPPDPVTVTPLAAGPGEVAVRVRVAEPWHVNRAFMALRFAEDEPRGADPAWSIGEPVLPEGEPWVDPNTGMQRIDLAGTFEMRAPVTGTPGRHELRLSVGYQACKASLCLMPAWKDVVATVELAAAPADAAGSAPAADAPAAGVADAADPTGGDGAGAGPAEGGGDAFSRARDSGVLPLVLLVFLAGLGVSFTPCVLPMVPITVGVIGASGASSRGRGIALAATYVAGLALVYTLLGVVAGLTGMVFGSWLSNPWVVGGIAGLFFLMGLAMFGLFDVAVPSTIQTRLSRYGGAGFGGAFVVGMVGALVAGPCSGPVLVSIIALIGKQGEVGLGALLMVVFSLGMGVIFLVAGAFSSTLVRPGPWMETVKKGFGLVMWAGALYFAAPQLSATATLLIAAAMLLSTAVYAWPVPDSGEGFWVERTRRLYSIVAGLVGGTLLVGWLLSSGLVGGVAVAPAGGGAVAAEEAGIGWLDDEGAALARARAEGRVVMIDFTADWCAACKELEHFTYTDPEVIAASRAMVPVMIDVTRDDDPEVRRLLDAHDVAGLPTVKFLHPDGTPMTDLTVTGFLEAPDFLERMRAALDRADR